TYDKQGQPTGHERRLVQPAGFRAGGLQFALDYAFFLTRQSRHQNGEPGGVSPRTSGDLQLPGANAARLAKTRERNEADQARAVLIEALMRIDMDRDPNRRPWSDPIPEGEPIAAPERPMDVHQRIGGTGVTRSEFIRLAFGALKTAGKEEELVKSLAARIDAGENRLRRVLAQVRLLQGQPEAALQLELDYVAAAKFDPLSTAHRRAVILDSAQKAREAVTEYELVLSLLNRPDLKAAKFNLPDPAEPVWIDRLQQSSGLPFGAYVATIDSQQAMRWNVMDALERLFAGLGETDNALEMSRELVAVVPTRGRIESLEVLERKHRTLNQSERFVEWAKRQLSDAKDHNLRASLQWLLGDRQAAAESLAKVAQRR
ncbi:MAG TPA: hypothetical protein VK137_18515, partial [Planctomycetaceae bacterium]|nr:hypothetical protein [Planctomycetaceae bacterium]